jgi:hypothetical protein
MRDIIASIEGEFRRYKVLADQAIDQLADHELSMLGPGEGNSIVIIAWHLSGNLKSRFTDFLTSDGEKPWRNRDEEFESRKVTRSELKDKWNGGWDVLFASLQSLSDADLFKSVVIRGESFKVHEALHRLMAHAAYHAGQIVYLAKCIRGRDWKCLSIPLGGSSQFNRNPVGQRPPSS